MAEIYTRDLKVGGKHRNHILYLPTEQTLTPHHRVESEIEKIMRNPRHTY